MYIIYVYIIYLHGALKRIHNYQTDQLCLIRHHNLRLPCEQTQKANLAYISKTFGLVGCVYQIHVYTPRGYAYRCRFVNKIALVATFEEIQLHTRSATRVYWQLLLSH